MSFLAELKRRNVIRMAGLYIVGAWLVVQVAETLLPAFDVPAWVLRATILLLAIGFIPALVFAWVFELTPEGLKRERDIDRSLSIVDHTARKLDVAVIVLLLGVAALIVWRPGGDGEAPGSVEPTKIEQSNAGQTSAAPATGDATQSAPSASNPSEVQMPATTTQASIAVLPFLNMSPDADNEYFADGIAEELLNVLSRIEGLKVASRTSAFTFKGKDTPIPEIARLLDVRHVLEGSVRKQGQHVRITAQLINAGSDGHVWSQTYDRELTDIFKIQEEIAASIAAELGGLLGTRRLAVDAPTSDLLGYEHFLRGRARFHQRSELVEAIADLEYAVKQDPQFAEAWIYLSATNLVFPGYSDALPGAQTRAAARAAGARAAALAPNHPMVLAIQGSIHDSNAEQVEALELYQRAAKLSTQDSTPLMWLGQTLVTAGYIDEAIAVLERAVLMDPLVGINNGSLAWAYFSAGRFERGAASARAAAANGWEAGLLVQAVELALSGRRQQAAELLAANPNALGMSSAEQQAFIAAIKDPSAANDYLALRSVKRPPDDLLALGMHDRFFDWFARAAEPDSDIRPAAWGLRTVWLPSTRSLREDPRFMQVAEYFGLIKLWEQRGYPPGCRRVSGPAGDHLDCSGETR